MEKKEPVPFGGRSFQANETVSLVKAGASLSRLAHGFTLYPQRTVPEECQLQGVLLALNWDMQVRGGGLYFDSAVPAQLRRVVYQCIPKLISILGGPGEGVVEFRDYARGGEST